MPEQVIGRSEAISKGGKGDSDLLSLGWESNLLQDWLAAEQGVLFLHPACFHSARQLTSLDPVCLCSPWMLWLSLSASTLSLLPALSCLFFIPYTLWLCSSLDKKYQFNLTLWEQQRTIFFSWFLCCFSWIPSEVQGYRHFDHWNGW